MSTQRPSRSPSRRIGLDADLAQLVLDLVDDRLDLPVVGAAGEQEGVGDRELLAHVEGEEVGGELVGGGAGRRVHQLDGVLGRGQFHSGSAG